MRELQTWVVRLMEEERLSIVSKTWKENGLKATVVIGILSFLWFSAPFMRSLSTFLVEYFVGMAYQVQQQSEMAGVAYRKGMYLAGVLLTVAVLLDLLQRWMQVSAMAGWVTPQDSPLQRCLFPFASWSLSMDMLVPKDVQSRQQQQQQQQQDQGKGQGQGQGQGGGFGMNMAPMIFMGVTGYVKAKLQEWGTKPIADYVLKKAKKKEEKKSKLAQEQQEKDAQDVQQQFSMGDDDDDGQCASETAEHHQAFRQAVDASFRASAARATYTATSAMDPAKQRMNDRYAESMRSGDVSFLDQKGDADTASGPKVRWADSDAGNGGSDDESEEVLTGKTSRK